MAKLVRSEIEREYIRQIRKAYKRLSGRMTTLLKHSEVVSPALQVFKQSQFFDVDTGKVKSVSVKDLNLKQLRTLKSDIYYFEGLKTSALKYAKSYSAQNASLITSIHMLPDVVEKQFWDIYKRYAQTYKNYEQVKYTALEEIFENFDKYDPEELAKMIAEEHAKMYQVDEVFTSTTSHIDYTIKD